MRALLLLCLFAAGCGLMRDPVSLELADERLTVHSVLVVGQQRAAVLVTVVRGSNDDFTGVVARPVVDADVRLQRGAETFQLTRRTSGQRCTPDYTGSPGVEDLDAGCYVADIPGGLQSGERYELRIDADARGTVQGSVTLPSIPGFLTPAPQTRIRVDFFDQPGTLVTVRWNGVPARRWTELYAEPVTTDCDAFLRSAGESGAGRWVQTTEADSFRVHIGDSGCSISESGMPAELILIAYDSVYTRYALSSFNRSTTVGNRSSHGITGALGLFAGAARARLPVLLSRN